MRITYWLSKKFAVVFLFFGSVSSFAQTCNERVLPATPDSRFELSVSGDEVKDLKTGMIWQRCSVGQSWDGFTCNGSATWNYWEWALTMGDGQWRLPNIKELSSIVETACVSPSINTNIFPNTQSGYYWSSSPSTYTGGGFAWIVDFSHGHARPNYMGNYKGNYEFFRLVRGGQ